MKHHPENDQTVTDPKTGEEKTLIAVSFTSDDMMPETLIAEIMSVGAVADMTAAHVGKRYKLNDRTVVYTEEITRERYLERVRAAGLPAEAFRCIPPQYKFWAFKQEPN